MPDLKEIIEQIKFSQVIVSFGCFIIIALLTSYEYFLQRNIKIDRVFLLTSIAYPICQLARSISLTFFNRAFQTTDSTGYIILASVVKFIQQFACLSTMFYILAIQYVKIILTSSNLVDLKKQRERQNYITITLNCIQILTFLGIAIGKGY